MRRCYRCNGFHHLASKCALQTDICPRCSQTHNLRDCKSQELCCINCSNFNKGNKNSAVDTKHTVWDKNCHVYQQNLAKFKNNILGTQ